MGNVGVKPKKVNTSAVRGNFGMDEDLRREGTWVNRTVPRGGIKSIKSHTSTNHGNQDGETEDYLMGFKKI
jgi:hypothetical protein